MGDGGQAPAIVALETPPTRPEALNCLRCGYALAGLGPAMARCPECGLSIEASRRGEWLGNADPVWLERLGRGLRQVRVACLFVLGTFLLSITFIAAGMALGPPVVDVNHWLGEAAAVIVVAGTVGFGLTGWRNVTRQEPDVASQSVNEPERFVLLGSIYVGIGAVALSVVAQIVRMMGAVDASAVVGRVAFATLGVAGGVHVLAALRPFARLARRAGSPKHAKQCTGVFWCGVVGLSAFGITSIMGQSFMGQSLSRAALGRGLGGGWALVGFPLPFLDLLAALTPLLLPLAYVYMTIWIAAQVERAQRSSKADVPGPRALLGTVEPLG